jgi:hypothetical protein
MAVTYSWRIDTNKYAYLLPPMPLEVSNIRSSGYKNNDWKNYGYLSDVPLTDFFANNVAKAANQQFGEGSDGGLSGYTKAFEVMEQKINAAMSDSGYYQKLSGSTGVDSFEWKKDGLESVDLLSADIYFNVDASECADLKGVGIKGIRYLGSKTGMTYVSNTIDEEVTGVDLDNLSYIPVGNVVSYSYINSNGDLQTASNVQIKPGIPGFTDVYGIYMDDQTDSEGNIGNNTTPESIFVIRNAKDGARGDAGNNGTNGTNSETEYLEALQKKLNNTLTSIQKIIDEFNAFAGEGGLGSTLTKISDLESRLKKLEETPTGGGETDEPVISGGGSITIYKNTIDGAGDFEKESVVGPNGEELICEKDTVYLLGYLVSESDKGKPSITANHLYALPYIRVNGTTIEIDGSLNVIKNVKAQNITSTNNTFSEKGFYQSGPTNNADVGKNGTFGKI